MHFMFLILAFLLSAVVWGFFQSNPRGVSSVKLLICNIALLAFGVAAGVISGYVLYGDALIRRPDERMMAVYLSIMAGGTAFMIVAAAGGLARNVLVFPLSSRSRT